MRKQKGRKMVIVGGGIAGLCTAVYARKCGYEVQLAGDARYGRRAGDELGGAGHTPLRLVCIGSSAPIPGTRCTGNGVRSSTLTS